MHRTIVFFLYALGVSFSLSITATQVIFFILLILFLLIRLKSFHNLEQNKYLFIFLAYIFVNGIFLKYSQNINLIKHVTKPWHIAFLYLGYSSLRFINIKKIMFSILLGAFFQSFYGIYQKIFLNYERSQGFFTQALTYSNSLALVIISSLILFSIDNLKRKSNIIKVVFIIIFVGFVFSQSRGPLLSLLAVFLFCIYIFRNKQIFRKVLILFTIIFVLIYIFNLNNFYNEFLKDNIYNPAMSIGNRIALYKASIEIIKKNPLFGIGVGTFSQYVKKVAPDALVISHAHNSYLQRMVEYGIIGFILLMIFKISFIIDLYKKIMTPYSKIGICLFIYMFLESFTEDVFADAEVAMLFWFLVGIIKAQNSKQNNLENELSSS